MKTYGIKRYLGIVLSIAMALTLCTSFQTVANALTNDTNLIFYVDANNYDGNGSVANAQTTATTWTDLSGKGNHMNLVSYAGQDKWTANGWLAYNDGTGTVTNETTLPGAATSATWQAIANGGSFTFEFVADNWASSDTSTTCLFRANDDKFNIFRRLDGREEDLAYFKTGNMYQTSSAACDVKDFSGQYNTITVSNVTSSKGEVGTGGYMEIKWYVNGELKSMAKGKRGANSTYTVGTTDPNNSAFNYISLLGYATVNGTGNTANYKMMKLYTTALSGAQVRANVNDYYDSTTAAKSARPYEDAMLHRYYFSDVKMVSRGAVTATAVTISPLSANDTITGTVDDKMSYTSASTTGSTTAAGLQLYPLYGASTTENALISKNGKIWHISWKQTPTDASESNPQIVRTFDNTGGSNTHILIEFGDTIKTYDNPVYYTVDGLPIACDPTKEYQIDYVWDCTNIESNTVSIYLDNVLYATATHDKNTSLTNVYRMQFLAGTGPDKDFIIDDVELTTYNSGYITDSNMTNATATKAQICALVESQQEQLVSTITYTEGNEIKNITLADGQRNYTVSLPDNSLYTTINAVPVSNDYTLNYYVQDVIPGASVVGSIANVTNTGNAHEMITMRRPAINKLIPVKNESTKAIVELVKDGMINQVYTITFNANQPSLTSLTYPSSATETEKQVAFTSGAAMNNDSGTVLSSDRAKFIGSNISSNFVGASLLTFPYDAANKISTWTTSNAEYFTFTADTAGTIYISSNGAAPNYQAGSAASNDGWQVVQEFSNNGYAIIDGEDPVKSVNISDWKLVDKSWNNYTVPKYFYNSTEWNKYSANDVRSQLNQFYFTDLTDSTGIVQNTRKLGGYLYKYTFTQNEEVTVYTLGADIGQMAGVIVWDTDNNGLNSSIVTEQDGTDLYVGLDVYGEAGDYDGIVLLAMYDSVDGKLLGLYEPITFTGPAQGEYVGVFDVSEITGSVIVKGFIWSDLETIIMPLTQSKEKTVTIQ